MTECLYYMADTDVKESTQRGSTKVDTGLTGDYVTFVKGTSPDLVAAEESPFKDNGKNGLFKPLDSTAFFNTNVLKGHWEIKEDESYKAMIGTSQVKVLGEKDYFVAKVPALRAFYIEGSKPKLGRLVPPSETSSGKVETEVVVENSELVRKLPSP